MQTGVKQTVGQEQVVKIVTVDPATRRVEGQMKDVGFIQISVDEVPPLFRWPVVGEFWKVTRQFNKRWMLCAPYETRETEFPIEELAPGETKIDANVIRDATGTPLASLTTSAPPSPANTYYVQDYGLVTALPGSPSHGQTCTYTNSLTVPTYAWRLMYNSSQTAGNRWLVIGGTPIIRTDEDQRAITSTAWGAFPTDPMSFTLPLAGDYRIEISSAIWNTAGGFFSCQHSYSVAGSTTYSGLFANGVAISSTQVLGTRAWDHTGLAANTTIAEVAQITSGGGGYVQTRRIEAMPMRVG